MNGIVYSLIVDKLCRHYYCNNTLQIPDLETFIYNLPEYPVGTISLARGRLRKDAGRNPTDWIAYQLRRAIAYSHRKIWKPRCARWNTQHSDKSKEIKQKKKNIHDARRSSARPTPANGNTATRLAIKITGDPDKILDFFRCKCSKSSIVHSLHQYRLED